MIRLTKISKSELPMLIVKSYTGDTELLEKYHIAKFDLPGAVLAELSRVEEMSKAKKIDCYKVIHEKQPIGYVVTFGNTLYSFSINIKFRKKDILIGWWNEIKKVLGKNFVCNIYNNNTRCIEFLKKQQMEIIEVNKEHNFVTLLNTK